MAGYDKPAFQFDSGVGEDRRDFLKVSEDAKLWRGKRSVAQKFYRWWIVFRFGSHAPRQDYEWKNLLYQLLTMVSRENSIGLIAKGVGGHSKLHTTQEINTTRIESIAA